MIGILVMVALFMGLESQGLCCALLDPGPQQIMLGRTQVSCDGGQNSTEKHCLVMGMYQGTFVVVPLYEGTADKLFLVRVKTSQNSLQWFWSGNVQDTIASNYGGLDDLLYYNYGPGGGWFGNAVFVDEPVDGTGGVRRGARKPRCQNRLFGMVLSLPGLRFHSP